MTDQELDQLMRRVLLDVAAKKRTERKSNTRIPCVKTIPA